MIPMIMSMFALLLLLLTFFGYIDSIFKDDSRMHIDDKRMSFPDPVLPSYIREYMFCSSNFIAELKQLDLVRNIYNFEMTAEIILSSNENHIQV
jgi:hypothetical protein